MLGRPKKEDSREKQYRIRLNDPTTVRLDGAVEVGGTTYPCAYVELGNPGVPHSLYLVPGLADKSLAELRPLARQLRHDPVYPKGANANLYDRLGPDHLVIRTFERGVEDFTLACGTGTGSLVALLTQAGGVTGQGVQVENLGGTLTVDALCQDGVISRLYLTGPAVLVYRGWLEDFPE